MIEEEILAAWFCETFSINHGLPLGKWENQTPQSKKRWLNHAQKFLEEFDD